MPQDSAPKFGIGEWYGHSFVNLSRAKRLKLANTALGPVGSAPECPFMGHRCNKKGGVCSLRLYQESGDPGGALPVADDAGKLRTLCPERFKQEEIIYRTIGRELLGTEDPIIVSEVRFLQKKLTDEQGKEDVGNIDSVLVHPDLSTLRWCVLEIQAVYFSGPNMPDLFRHYLVVPDKLSKVFQ